MGSLSRDSDTIIFTLAYHFMAPTGGEFVHNCPWTFRFCSKCGKNTSCDDTLSAVETWIHSTGVQDDSPLHIFIRVTSADKRVVGVLEFPPAEQFNSSTVLQFFENCVALERAQLFGAEARYTCFVNVTV